MTVRDAKMRISKILFILLLLLTVKLFASEDEQFFFTTNDFILKTNENQILQKQSLILSLDNIKYKDNKNLSYAEILYGRFENYRANLTIARESSDRGYIINYLRERMDSFNIGSKKIYNSSFGIDVLDTGINYLFSPEMQINFNFNYKYFTKGMMTNPIYDIQNKRKIYIVPEFKYFFSESSTFSAALNYYEIKSEYESSSSSLLLNINGVKSTLSYEKLWSEINALTANFVIYQYTMKYNSISLVNNIGIVDLREKFALSRTTVINLKLGMNFNKKYSPILSTKFDVSFSLLPLNIVFEVLRSYNADYFNDLIMDNYFIKINGELNPMIDNSYSIGFKLYLLKSLFLRVKPSYDAIKNFPAFVEDNDKLSFIENLDYDAVRILSDINFAPSEVVNFAVSYQQIPYLKSRYNFVPYLTRDKVDMRFSLNLEHIKFDSDLVYYNIRDYIDIDNNVQNLKSSILFNFKIRYFFSPSLAAEIEAKNINNREYYKISNYVEPEKLLRAGIYTRF